MLTIYLALVSETNQVPFSQLSQIASALQKQITRDFSPIWKKPASIDAFASLDEVPSDYWPIIIRDNIDMPGAAGYHADRNGIPFALVSASADTSLTCSHEMLEMLGDPFGNRLVAAQSIKPGQGRVNYLVEVSDPSEATDFSYTINGIRVSDFYTPNFFDPVTSAGVRYSFTGAIKAPRQVLPGGYLSWQIPATGEWWQATFFGRALKFRSLGVLARNGKSWREVIDAITSEPMKERNKRTKNMKGNLMSMMMAPESQAASAGRAEQLRGDIAQLLKTLK